VGHGPNRPLWADGFYVTFWSVRGGRLLSANSVSSGVTMGLAAFAEELISPTGILPASEPGEGGANGFAR
jgi:hypothetical protein